MLVFLCRGKICCNAPEIFQSTQIPKVFWFFHASIVSEKYNFCKFWTRWHFFKTRCYPVYFSSRKWWLISASKFHNSYLFAPNKKICYISFSETEEKKNSHVLKINNGLFLQSFNNLFYFYARWLQVSSLWTVSNWTSFVHFGKLIFTLFFLSFFSPLFVSLWRSIWLSDTRVNLCAKIDC